MSLRGRCALVTGAATGIGFAIAQALCEQGMSLALNDVDADAGQLAASRLTSAGHNALALPGDVTDAVQVAGTIITRLPHVVLERADIDLPFADDPPPAEGDEP